MRPQGSTENSDPFPGNLSILLDACREQTPERDGIGTPEKMLTFAQYHDTVCRLASGLRGLGLERNDRVLLSSLAPLAYATLSLAVFRLGAVLIPVNPRMGPYELAHILSETRPRLVVCNAATIPTILKACELVREAPFPSLITLDEKVPSTPFVEELALSEPLRQWEKMAADETAMIVFTAAMEGYPLGAQLTHGSLFSDTIAFARRSFRENDADSEILFSLLPLFHTYGFTNGFLVPLAGAVTCLLLGTSLRGRTVVDLMARFRPTQIISVPALFHGLLKPLSEKPGFLAGIRNLTSGGIGISKKLLDLYEEKLGLTISEGYGLTEASPVVTWNGLDRPPKFGTVGPPLSCCQVKIVGDRGEEVSPGEEGEVLVKGSNLFSGYLNRPEHTRKSFVDGWFRTGDLGRLDDEDYLTITGLKKDMVNVFGLKAYPREIERLLGNHPDIASALIRREWHDRYGGIVAGDIYLKPGRTMSERSFFDWCRRHISPYKIPRDIRIH